MKSKYIPLLLICCSITVPTCFSCCAPENKCEDSPPAKGNTYPVSSIDQSYVLPYKDFDTIKFRRNNTDTVLFISSKVESGYYEELSHEPCPRYEQLQQIIQTFAYTTNSIKLRYFVLPSFLMSSSSFEMVVNNRQYGPDNSYDVINTLPRVPLSVLGIPYYAIPYRNGPDSVYFKTQVGIVRMRTQGNIYEKIP